jgi:hypothetical protein
MDAAGDWDAGAGTDAGAADLSTIAASIFSAMPERHSDILQILIGEIAKHRYIDLVLGKGSCATVVSAPVAPILKKSWAPTPTQIVPVRAK